MKLARNRGLTASACAAVTALAALPLVRAWTAAVEAERAEDEPIFIPATIKVGPIEVRI